MTTKATPGVGASSPDVGPGTALPWWLDETDPDTFEIVGATDSIVAPIVVSGYFDERADAAYIVRACNALPAMLEALEGLLDSYIASRRFDGEPLFEIEAHREVVDARAAIALARTGDVLAKGAGE